MSRVDPVSIAIYRGGTQADMRGHSAETRAAADNDCPLVRGPYDFHSGAIDLDCFRFMEDWPARTSAERQIIDVAAARIRTEMREAEAARLRAQPASRAAVPPPSVNPRLEPSLRPLLAYSRAATRRVDRNRLTAILLKHSDDVCAIELGRITANQATVNAAFNILGTGATTVANIVTGTQAQNILTGIGTFAGASRSHINADVYRNTFAYALSRAITLEREKQRGVIEGRYREELEAFTIDDAIRAANSYHGQCSFYKGLELLLASVENGATLDRSLRERERQLQIVDIEEEIARLNRDIGSRPRTDATAEELFRRLDEATAARSTLVLTPVSTSPPPVTTPPVPPPPTDGGT